MRVPNLVGLIDPGASEEALDADLERMVRIVDDPDFGYAVRRAKGAGIRCANLLSGVEDNLRQPARDPATGAWLMLDGELLGADALKEELEAAGTRVVGFDDAELAMAAFVAFGDRFFERLDGQWNLVLHIPSKRTTRIISDRIGSRLLYFSNRGGRWIFASEMKAMIVGRGSEATAPGGFGLFELFRASQIYGDRTWCEDVRVLDPGTILEINEHDAAQRRYFQLSFNEGGPLMTEASYVDGFQFHLERASRRCVRVSPAHRVGLCLSGGLDSRAVLLSLPKDQPVHCVTYGDASHGDVRYARRLAELAGKPWQYLESDLAGLLERSHPIVGGSAAPGFYGAQWDRVVWRHEAMGDPSGGASMVWHPSYSRSFNVILSGACGDALTGSHLAYWMMDRCDRRTLIDRLRGRHLRSLGTHAPADLLGTVCGPRPR